ncbi:hypothetical protein, partial [Pontibacter korlensis]
NTDLQLSDRYWTQS